MGDQHTDTGRRCCTCGRATDRTLNERGKMKVELRPYGPGGADICFECATASPAAEKQTADSFAALLDANEGVSPTGVAMIGQDSGPVPFDPDLIDGNG